MNPPSTAPAGGLPPVDPDALSASQLTELLDPLLDDGTQIVAVSAERIGEGRGIFGTSFRLELAYDRPTDLPPVMVAKLPAQHAPAKARAVERGLYEREVRFYAEVAPTLDVAVPACFGSWIDTTTQDFVLLLECIEPLDAVDQLQGCSLPRATSVVGQLARLHAARWNSGLERLDWVPTLDDPSRVQGLQEILADGWDRLVAVAGDTLTRHQRTLGEKLAADLPSELAVTSELPPTLIHGDPRLDNILFRVGEDDPVLVDWQGLTRGPGGFDLGFFLCQSLSVPERRRHEPELVAAYRQVLSEGGADASEEDILRPGLRIAAAYSVVVACSVAAAGNEDEPRATELARQMAARSLTALEDWT